MPDLTIEIKSQCKSLSVNSANVGGYQQEGLGSERTWPTCSCPAYKFSKRTINFGGQMVPPPCKHIKEAEKKACGWHEMWSDEKQTTKGICPRCGGETEYVQVAV